MAVNPITSESLTVDFKTLMSIPVGDRARAASYSQDFLQSILNALTPIQIAKAFPDYYRRSLPDVSNFITSYIQTRNGGAYNQTGGGDGGYSTGYYSPGNNVNGSAKPAGSELSIDEMKKKLLEKGINIDNTYDILSNGPILEGDERLLFMKNMSGDELLKAGLEKVQDENGKTLIRMISSKYDSMTDEQLMEQAKKTATVDKLVPNEKGYVDQDQLYKVLVNRFSNSSLNGFVPEDGKTFGVEKGTPEEWARLALALGKQESSLHAKPGGGYRGGMYQFAEADLKRYGVEGDVFDPNVQVEAMAKQWEKYIPTSGAIAGRGDGPGTYGGYRGGAAYFEPLRYPEQLAKHWQSVDKTYESYKENPLIFTAEEDPEEIKKRLKEFERNQFVGELTKETYMEASPTSSGSVGLQDVDLSRAEYSVRSDGSTLGPKERRQLREQGGITVNLDNNAGAENNTSSFDPMIVIPDDATDAQIAAAEAYVNSVAEAYNNKFGTKLKGKVVTRGQNGRGRTDTIHTEAFNVRDKAGIDYFYNTEEGQAELAKITASTLGQIPGASFQLPHGGLEGKDKGATGLSGSEVDLASKLLGNLSNIKEELKKQKEIAAAEAEKPTPSTTVTNAIPDTEQKAAEVPASKTVASTPPVETPAPETVASATPATTPVPQFALGGNMYGINEDMTLVETATGNPIAQIGQNEKIEKQGNAIQVTPETKLKADELTEKYDISSDVEDRMSDMEDRIDNQNNNNQIVQKAREPERVQNNAPESWRESIASGDRPVSPSFNRAMARTKFFPEGHHFNRSSPASTS